MKLYLLVMSLLLGYPSASAQEKPCTKTTEFDRSTNSIRVIDCKRKVLSQSTLNPPSKSSTIETSSAVDPFYTKVQESFAQYAIWQNNYTQRIFAHQIVYTVIIFVVVNLLVLAGLYFAWLQFRATLRLHQLIERSHPQAFVKQKHAAKPGHEIPPAELDNPFPINELRFGPDGIAISSAFIGLIILGFSMGFYFLYLTYVYPIKTAGAESSTTKTVQTVSSASSPSSGETK